MFRTEEALLQYTAIFPEGQELSGSSIPIDTPCLDGSIKSQVNYRITEKRVILVTLVMPLPLRLSCRSVYALACDIEVKGCFVSSCFDENKIVRYKRARCLFLTAPVNSWSSNRSQSWCWLSVFFFLPMVSMARLPVCGPKKWFFTQAMYICVDTHLLEFILVFISPCCRSRNFVSPSMQLVLFQNLYPMIVLCLMYLIIIISLCPSLCHIW